jgi:MoaA/NifB/PqqE/SkfB family radical SAM enzyme
LLVEDNTYENLYVDITYKCNMKCAYCYNHLNNTSKDDWFMDIGYFEKVCKKLPNKTTFRLLGGEPALHPKFFDFIKIADRYGHIVHFATNGLVFVNPAMVKKLKRVIDKCKSTVILSLTMDGGVQPRGGTYQNRNTYKVMNGQDCYRAKIKAFRNFIKYGVGRIAVTAIIARGVNEFIVPQLIQLANRYPEIRYLHFRTAAAIGTFLDKEPYTMDDLKEMVSAEYTPEQMAPNCIGEISCSSDSGNTCCYRFRPTKRVQVSLIEFASEGAQNCTKRGKLLENYEIVPWFKEMNDSFHSTE